MLDTGGFFKRYKIKINKDNLIFFSLHIEVNRVTLALKYLFKGNKNRLNKRFLDILVEKNIVVNNS